MKKGTVVGVLVIAGLLALSAHGKEETAVMPDSTGQVLEVAQSAARQAGFTTLASHDALREKRMQFLDQNWKVCSQTPTAGRHAATTRVDFAVVKLSERCP